MTVDEAKNAVIAVLQGIQARSGLPCPMLDGLSIPPKLLKKFDSTVWPAATTLVARKLGVNIPNNIHIFGGEKGTPLLNINQAAQLIVREHKPKAPLKVAA